MSVAEVVDEAQQGLEAIMVGPELHSFAATAGEQQGWNDKLFFTTYLKKTSWKQSEVALVQNAALSMAVSLMTGTVSDNYMEAFKIVLFACPSTESGKELFGNLVSTTGEAWGSTNFPATSPSDNDYSMAASTSKAGPSQKSDSTTVLADEIGTSETLVNEDGKPEDEWISNWKRLIDVLHKMEEVKGTPADPTETISKKQGAGVTTITNEFRWALGTLSLMGMMLLRLGIKPVESVQLAIQTGLRSHVTQFFGAYSSMVAPLPNATVYEKLKPMIGFGTERTNKIMAIIVFNYMLSAQLVGSVDSDKGLLEAGVLRHTQMNGLIPIKLFEDYISYLKITVRDGFSTLGTTRTKASLWKLGKHYQTYGAKSSLREVDAIKTAFEGKLTAESPNEQSWGWAKLFNSSFFLSWAAKHHIPLIARMAGVITGSAGRENLLGMQCLQNAMAQRILDGDKIRIAAIRSIYIKTVGIFQNPIAQAIEDEMPTETDPEERFFADVPSQ